MKRCPKCRRDYYDETLLYCLDDGNALLEGPASADEPATAILSEPGVKTGFPPSESPTVQLQTPATAGDKPPKQLTDFKTDQIYNFAWSPDGKQLVLSRGTTTSDVVLIKDFK